MIKAFISHSSAQKEFVRELEQAVGLDNCVVDERTFESGRLIIDEIKTAVNRCEVFVFLISEEALESDWVKTELSNIRDLIDDGTFSVFLPFIIDARVKHTDTRIKAWIKRDYILEEYVSPVLLSRRIKEKIRDLVWKEYPKIARKEELFKGRDEELGLLDQKYYDGRSEQRRCIVVSGFPPGVGRRRFLTEYIITKVNTNKGKSYEPTCIELGENHSIENLIFQLNDLFLLYGNDEVLEISRKTKEEKAGIAVSLIREAVAKKEAIIIRDNGACVLSNGYLSSWFKDVVTNENLPKKLCLFLASQHFVNNNVERNLQQIIPMQINPLAKKAARVLLYAYAEITETRIDSETENVILNNISGIPSLIFRCVDVVKTSPQAARPTGRIEEVIKSEEKSYIAIIDVIKRDEDVYQALILLAQFEFVSFDIVCTILSRFHESPDDLLQVLYSYSLFERFGGNSQYIKVNSVVADYISREKIRLNPQFRNAFEETIKGLVVSGKGAKYDLSGYLYGIQSAIREDIRNVDKKYLIPSFTLNVIIEEYKAGEHDNVIVLCDKFLDDSNNYYDEVVRNIRYWLCSSLCRLQEERFFQEIDHFEGYSKQFLLGFYHRWKKDYDKALDYYEKALALSKSNRDKSYVAKAKHELVIVKLLRKDYAGALELAKENYESQKTNKYHIEAYFRCLIRSYRSDQGTLSSLLKEYESLVLDKKNRIILDTLKAEFTLYVKEDFPEAVKMLKDAIERAGSNIRYYPYRSLQEILARRDAKTMKTEIEQRYQGELGVIDEEIED